MNLNEGYLRQEFLVKANRIYFDHAKVSPLPRCVRDAVNAFTKDASEHGTKNYKDWMTEVAHNWSCLHVEYTQGP